MSNANLSNAKITLDISLLNEFTEFLNAKANGTCPAKEPEYWYVEYGLIEDLDDISCVTTAIDFFTSEAAARKALDCSVLTCDVLWGTLGKAKIYKDKLIKADRIVHRTNPFY